MRRALVGLIIACTGCLQDDLVYCASGIACPAELVCDDAHATCVEPEQLSSCAGKADLDACLDGGACHDGVCLPVGCGNGRRDPDEVCDDGNTASADGCAADCSSREECGNGTIDPVNSEQCDEGDLVDHDGCDSRCRLEEPDWTPFVQLASHPPREQMAMAYDSARERLVMFGGFEDVGVTRNGTTLEWDGVRRTWLDRTPAITPTARAGAGFAFDAARDVCVLFGGSDFGGAVADMWLWDGDRWELVAASGPSGRLYASMAYDPKGKRTLVFGGRSNTGAVLGDMWSWDGTAWTELQPQVLPPKRERAQMAYDELRGEMVLVGGVDGSPKADTWLFDGTAWRAGPVLPEGRFAGQLAWDASRGVLALLGGSGTMDRVWDGTQWLPDGAANFIQRMYPFVYYDPRRAALIGGLGYRFSDNTMLFDATSCAAPACGDGACDADRESCGSCASDCGACP